MTATKRRKHSQELTEANEGNKEFFVRELRECCASETGRNVGESPTR